MVSRRKLLKAGSAGLLSSLISPWSFAQTAPALLQGTRQRQFTRLMPDQATLAGLVHQIGILPILTYAEDHNELLSDSISLNHVIEQIHPIIGEKILRTWEFPEQIAMVPSQYLDFTRDSAKVDYVDIVQVATLQSYIGTEHPYTKLDWSQIPAFAKLGLDPSKDMHEDEDLSAAMEAAMSMLQ